MRRRRNEWRRRILHPLGVVLLVVGYLSVGSGSVLAGQDYYSDTGHYLFGQFRDYWNANGGLLQFGYPITKVINAKSENGQTYPTQYLQRAVFEEHPENAGTPFEVLGRRLAALQAADRIKTDPNFQAVPQPNDGRLWFMQTNHTLGGSDPGNDAIRKFWEAAGNGNQQKSILIFGYPISEPFDEMNAAPPAGDGMMHRVQYFERYRLEYHPENPPQFQVLLGLLGVSQADKDGIPTSDPNRVPEAAGQNQPACIQAAVGGMCPAGSGGGLPQSYANLHIGDGGDGYGFNIDALGLDDAGQKALFDRVQEAGFGWVRQQIRWASLEASSGNFGTDYTVQLDKFVNAANARGLKILLSPVNSPGFTGAANGGLPTNPADMTRLMSFLGDRYKGKIAAYEVWNEENYAVETGGSVNIGAYPPILKAAYQALKARDKNITVVLGGMTPTATTDPSVALNEVQYLTQLYTQFPDVKNNYDVLGVHPGSNCNPPDTSWPDNPAMNPCGTDSDGSRSYQKDDSFYFKRILEMRNVMEQNGESGKKMWLTEFGWDSSQVVVPNYQYSQYVSDDQQAQYLTAAINLGKGYPWMGVMFVWNLNFQQTTADPNNEKYGWGVLNQDGSPRAAFTALKNLPK